MAIFTPEGTEIILFPIRDIACSGPLLRPRKAWLPNLAQKFAADAFLTRRLPGHEPARSGKNGDAHPADNRANPGLCDVTARPRPRNPLEVGDHAAPVGGVTQENTQRLFPFLLLHHFVIREITLVLQNSRDLDFEL